MRANSKNGDQDRPELGLVIGVAATAGELEPLKKLCKALAKDGGMTFIILDLSASGEESALAEALRPAIELPVEFAKDGVRLVPNHVYFSTAAQDLSFEGGLLRLAPRSMTHCLPLPVDKFFSSLAQAFGSHAVAVAMAADSLDGGIGLQYLRAAGGLSFACMAKPHKHQLAPPAIGLADQVDFVLSPAGIASELTRQASLIKKASLSAGLQEEQNASKEILALLREAFGVDFTDYKQTTVSRRIHKRLVANKLDSLAAYVAVLKSKPDELEALYGDVLINVTSFFRDPEMFAALQALVIPKFVENRGSDDPIRIWVPGCSSGEEVYSLAILLAEYCTKRGLTLSFQIFGTDVSEPALEKARAGVYSPTIAAQVAPERLKTYFDEMERGYQIKKFLRDSCVFARQNVVADPPLSRMDLICCRNLLIYFGAALQERVVPIFHYALKSANGFLVLGKSELVDVFSDFFVPLEKSYKFYKKKDVPLRFSYQPVPCQRFPIKMLPSKTQGSGQPARDSELDVQRETDRFILANFSPSAVVITENCDIIQFRGHTAPYLAPAGRASFNLFKMLHPDLAQPVRTAIEAAKTNDARVINCRQLRYLVEEDIKHVNVRVVRLHTQTLKQRYFLVIFEDVQAGKGNPRLDKIVREDLEAAEATPSCETEQIRRLNDELEITRQHLQAIIDERDIGFEELQSANEEITSSNEELQTINQELETAKEELESSNEELTTLNEQLRHNMELLRRSEEQFRLLVTGVKDYAIFMLDQKGHILSWNEGAERINYYSKKEIIGKHFSIFYPEEARCAGRPEAELKQAIAEGRFEEEGLRMRKDASSYWVNAVITPLFSEDGQLYGFAKITRDITERKLAEEKFRQSELRFRNFVSAVQDYAIFMLDPQGHVMSWNEGAERIKGYKAEEIIGQHFSKFYPSDDAHRTAEELQIASQVGRYEEEGWRLRKDGKLIWARVTITAVKDEQGQLIGFSKVTRDLTEQRRTQEALKASEESFRRLVSGVKDYAIFMLDKSGHILSWNWGAEHIKGYTAEEVLGAHFSIFYSPEDRHKGKAELGLATSASQGRYEEEGLQLRKKDGTAFWANVVITALLGEDGNLSCYAVVTRDITERKRLQEAESAKMAAEMANRAKSIFLANMSHEIRTPLTAIVGFAEFLGEDPTLRPQTSEYIEAIKRNANHLSALVSEVLDLSKVEANQMEVKKAPTPLLQELDTVVSMLRAKAADKGLAIALVYESPVPETIWTDGLRLKQILVNIIGNAIKFTNAGSITVRVRFAKTAQQDKQQLLSLAVCDTGCGIAAAHQHEIFKPFAQVLESDPRNGGTGLGLSLSRQLAKLLGGDVVLTNSEPGKGSTFTISVDTGALEGIRMTQPQAPQGQRPFTSSQGGHELMLEGVRVLLVEDTIDNQILFQRILKARGAVVVVASNGKEGIHLAKEGDFDVILMDIRMPVVDGFDATMQLRHKKVKTPIIAFTAHATKEEKERSLRAGCNDYRSKPIGSNDLCQLVAEWSKKARQHHS